MALELDAAALRARYGEPLAGETFQVRPGLVMIVDYGPDRRVCRMSVSQSASHQRLVEVIDELSPLTERGKEIGHGLKIIGGYSMRWTLYEHVMLFESYESNNLDRCIGFTINFRHPDCDSPDPNQYHEA
jgi:hypothetical protein